MTPQRRPAYAHDVEFLLSLVASLGNENLDDKRNLTLPVFLTRRDRTRLRGIAQMMNGGKLPEVAK